MSFMSFMSFRVIRKETVKKVDGHVIKVETEGVMLSEGDVVRYGESIAVVNKKMWYKHPYLCAFFNVVKGDLPAISDIITVVNPYEDSQVNIEITSILKSDNLMVVKIIGREPNLETQYISSSGVEIVFKSLVTENPIENDKSIWVIEPNEDIKVGMVFLDKLETEAAEKLAEEKLAEEKLAIEKLAADKMAVIKENQKRLDAEKLAVIDEAAEKLVAEQLAAEESETEESNSEIPTEEVNNSGPKTGVKKKPKPKKPKKPKKEEETP